MRRSIKTILTALAVMVGAAAQAHDNPSALLHKHGLEIKEVHCRGGHVSVEWRESTGMCGGWHSNKCSYTCLYQVYSDWVASDGYKGRDTEPRAGQYHRCHIEQSWNPDRARSSFVVTQPSWGTGKWGVTMRDGWAGGEAVCGQ